MTCGSGNEACEKVEEMTLLHAKVANQGDWWKERWCLHIELRGHLVQDYA